MDSIIKNLRYGQCNERFCPKKSLNDKDKIIFKKIIKLAKINNNYDWYERELNILKKFSLLINDYPKYNYKPILGDVNHFKLLKIEANGFEHISFRYYIKYVNKKFNLNLSIPKIYKKAHHFTDLILTLKDYLNMPRPYQLLPYYPHINLKVEFCADAISAAAPSGHCFFGILLGFLIYNSDQYFFDNNYYELDRLIHIVLDFGFHRNMGGIHFLYDNYISYNTFKEFINVYDYDNKCKYVTTLSNILDKMFIIYE
jgi:hypothetical protein